MTKTSFLNRILRRLYWIASMLRFEVVEQVSGAAPLDSSESQIRRAIATASQDGILVSRSNGQIIECNPIAEKMFGQSRGDLLGAYLGGFMPDVNSGFSETASGKSPDVVVEVAHSDTATTQIRIENGNGQLVPVEMSVSTAATPDGPLTVSFIRDISKRIEAENALITARDQAQAGEQAKANLLAVMSHEMRTPLNGILGALQLLDETDLNVNQKGYVGVLETSARLLLRHVNSVLDISRVDSGIMDLNLKEFSPQDLIQGLIDSQDAAAMARGNKISFRTVGDAVGRVVGDEGLISQVILNLLGNAIKFTQNGQVDIEMERVSRQEVEIRVADTGVGISKTNLKKIFEEFVMVDSSFSREQEGTGLGLAIVRRIVAVLDGHVSVESELGEGTMFSLRLPLEAAERVIETEGSEPEDCVVLRSGISTLLVEDNEINRLIAREMLTNMGCDVTVVGDGEEGVSAAMNRHFDAIFMDISMPGTDGISATKKIRAGKGPNKATPIYALTAHALEKDMVQFERAGMNGTVLKPLQKHDLHDVLASAFPDSSRDPPNNGRTVILNDNLRRQAEDEFRRGVEGIGRAASNEHLVAEIHNLSGIAAVSGWTHSHSILSDAETQAKIGNLEAAKSAIGKLHHTMMTDGVGLNPT